MLPRDGIALQNFFLVPNTGAQLTSGQLVASSASFPTASRFFPATMKSTSSFACKRFWAHCRRIKWQNSDQTRFSAARIFATFAFQRRAASKNDTSA
jgi:hypothetical protein